MTTFERSSSKQWLHSAGVAFDQIRVHLDQVWLGLDRIQAGIDRVLIKPCVASRGGPHLRNFRPPDRPPPAAVRNGWQSRPPRSAVSWLRSYRRTRRLAGAGRPPISTTIGATGMVRCANAESAMRSPAGRFGRACSVGVGELRDEVDRFGPTFAELTLDHPILAQYGRYSAHTADHRASWQYRPQFGHCWPKRLSDRPRPASGQHFEHLQNFAGRQVRDG